MPDSGKRKSTELEAFLKAHPETRQVDSIFADLAGVLRGKRLPVDQADKLFGAGAALPGSVYLLSALGDNLDPMGLGFSDGDPDEIAKAIPGTLKPVPWADLPTAQVMITLERKDGRPYPFEPRNVLVRTLERFGELGLKPVVAFELEFYLIDPERGPLGEPLPPRSPVTGQREQATQVYGMNAVDDFAAYLDEVTEACAAQGVTTGAVSSEYAPGQFEINLQHQEDPLKAADDCVMFKRAVQCVARRQGVQATFMAKPFPECAGSGLHIHVSLLDDKGRNVFDESRGGGAGNQADNETLRHAMGGILDLMPASMAIYAPNVNSFRRFQPNIFVPIQRSWAHENRSVALRVPIQGGASRRIESRIAGADANPYLVLAATLAGIHHGLTGKIDPGPPAQGNACTDFDPALPFRPLRALERMAEDQILPGYFGADYPRTYAECKAKELEAFEALMSPQEFRWYLLAD